MFQQLYHAVAYLNKQFRDRSPTPATDTEIIFSSNSVDGLDDGDVYSHFESSISKPIQSSSRRMTVPSVHVLEYDTLNVVTLDPMHSSHTDLDDISQPENGVAADAEISASDSESEGSAKEDQLETINETPYVANEQEILGAVKLIILLFYNIVFVIKGILWNNFEFIFDIHRLAKWSRNYRKNRNL